MDNIFIRFGSKLYRQIVDLTLSLFGNNQADVVEAFNSTSRYIDDLLNIDNPYFEQMVSQIYPTELLLNPELSFQVVCSFFDL